MKSLRASIAIAMVCSVFTSIPAQAAPVTATGTNPSICNQEVGNAASVVAYRLTGGDCVVEFKNVGSTTWTVPNGVTSVSLLVVGGGGGGASRHGGGGGGGGVVYAEYFPVSGTVGIAVGSGGTGGASAIYGTSGSDSRLFANGEATAGSTGIIAKGGGFGDFYQWSSPNKFIGRAGDGGSGGGTAVPNPFTRDLGFSPWGNTDPRGYTIQSSQTQKNLSGNTLTSNVWQYGNNGAQGGNQDYWAGGGGGGAGGEGSRGGGGAGTNNQGGAGGAGVANSITDSSLSYGCGGGGGGGLSGGVSQSGGAGGTGCSGGGGSTGNAAATNGATNRGGGGGGGGLASNGTNGAGGSGGSGIVIVRYSPDTTTPTFASSSFSAAENIATSATAATIRVSESATVTISSGADAARFNISRSETDTAIIKFNVSPDFEAPIDSGGNNVYDLTLTATDVAGNAGIQAITITVTNVVDTSAISLFQLAGGATVAAYRTAIVITVTVTVASKITINSNGKVIPGCKNRLATGSGSTFTATCTWKASTRGAVTLTATATPTGAGITGSTASPISIRVGNRTGAR
jgi:hypothetical protein